MRRAWAALPRAAHRSHPGSGATAPAATRSGTRDRPRRPTRGAAYSPPSRHPRDMRPEGLSMGEEYELVHEVVDDYYGPRSGFADDRGAPHWFCAMDGRRGRKRAGPRRTTAATIRTTIALAWSSPPPPVGIGSSRPGRSGPGTQSPAVERVRPRWRSFGGRTVASSSPNGASNRTWPAASLKSIGRRTSGTVAG